MIGSSFLNSSSWGSEYQLPKDFLPSLGDSFALDIELQEECVIDSSSNGDEQCSAYSESPEHSFSSEDCDWSAFGEDIRSILPVTDSSASKLLEEECVSVINFSDLDDLDWVSLSNAILDPCSATDSANEASFIPTDSPRKKKKHTKPTEPTSPSKTWAKMNSRERLKAANALTEIISRHMSFREQVEIIKIIDPHAVLQPSATEFVINLSYLNDAKLKRICDYLRKRTSGLLDSSLMKFSTAKSKNASSAHRAKRKLKKMPNQYYVNEIEKREKKVIKQDQKEKRSGLFVKEKIIKGLTNPLEENEDVNILE